MSELKKQSLKNTILDYTFELFKKEWLIQALAQNEEDDDYDYDENQEIEDCKRFFYNWFKEK